VSNSSSSSFVVFGKRVTEEELYVKLTENGSIDIGEKPIDEDELDKWRDKLGDAIWENPNIIDDAGTLYYGVVLEKANPILEGSETSLKMLTQLVEILGLSADECKLYTGHTPG
jgi:hypothetical protein